MCAIFFALFILETVTKYLINYLMFNLWKKFGAIIVYERVYCLLYFFLFMFQHEEGSINIFSRIVSQLERDFSKDGISKKDIVMIEDLIRGLNPTDEIKYDKKKLFLFEVNCVVISILNT